MFYEVIGFDPEAGRPGRGKWIELGLEWVEEILRGDLSDMGKEYDFIDFLISLLRQKSSVFIYQAFGFFGTGLQKNLGLSPTTLQQRVELGVDDYRRK